MSAAAVRCVDAASQLHGGNSVTLEHGISDLWWTARLSCIAPVRAEMILNHVARRTHMQLANKAAFITGAGSGIGREIALAFAREGARVMAAYGAPSDATLDALAHLYTQRDRAELGAEWYADADLGVIADEYFAGPR